MEIGKEVISVYKFARGNEKRWPFGALADYARDATAEAMRLEWQLKLHNGISDREYLEHHNRTPENWKQEAHARLMGEKEGLGDERNNS